jgi:hypothetical protein
MVKYRASAFGMSRSWIRVWSPGVHALDLQDVGAEPRHQLRTRRPGLHAGEVDHLDAF